MSETTVADSPSDPVLTGIKGFGGLLAALGVLAAVLGLVLRILTHHPFFDESLHVHFLWLTSSGLTPHEDFWCQYPVLGYVVSLPAIRMLPENAYALLGLRAFTGAAVVLTGVVLARHGKAAGAHWLWGVAVLGVVASAAPFGRFLAEYSVDHFALLTGVAALALCLGPARPGRVGLAAALAVLSLVLTPKWMLPLAGGVTGFVLLGCLGTGRARTTLLATVAGAAAALVLASVLYALAGVSLIDDLTHAHVFMSKYKLSSERDLTGSSQLITVGAFLVRHPLAGILTALGIAGFLLSRRGRGWASVLPGGGILLGVLTALLALDPWLEQYLLPSLLGLGLFTPFAGAFPSSPRISAGLTLLVAGALLLVTGAALGPVADGFRETPLNVRNPESPGVEAEPAPPAVASLAQAQRILDLVPADETVFAAWPVHPLFRRDLTFVTTDERPSYRTRLEGDPAARFDPETLAHAFRERPPALISLMNLQTSMPPGWHEVCVEFLRESRGAYTDLGGDGRIFIRTDLIRRR